MLRYLRLITLLAILSSNTAAADDDWGMITAAIYESSQQRSNLEVDEHRIHDLNKFFSDHFNRHPIVVTEDAEKLLSPTLAIESLFDVDAQGNVIKDDINGNSGNTFKVFYHGKELVLERMPKWIFHSDNEQYDYESESALGEINGSYKLEDIFNGAHVRQVHHIVAKINNHWRTGKKQIAFYAIKEYVHGESVLHFDYSVNHRHKPGKKIEMLAATNFMIEFFEFVETLLNHEIFPFGTNDNNIILQYDNRVNKSKIDWKMVNYDRMFTHKEALNVGDIQHVLMNWGSMLTWRLCEYTGYSNHKLAPEYKKHPLWTQLNGYLDKKEGEFSDKMNGNSHDSWPKASFDDLKSIVTDILTILRTQGAS